VLLHALQEKRVELPRVRSVALPSSGDLAQRIDDAAMSMSFGQRILHVVHWRQDQIVFDVKASHALQDHIRMIWCGWASISGSATAVRAPVALVARAYVLTGSTFHFFQEPEIIHAHSRSMKAGLR